MPKYLVWEERKFNFYQEVEAPSKTQALKIAEELGEWEQDQSYVEYDYTVDQLPDEVQPEVDDLIKSKEESNG